MPPSCLVPEPPTVDTPVLYLALRSLIRQGFTPLQLLFSLLHFFSFCMTVSEGWRWRTCKGFWEGGSHATGGERALWADLETEGVVPVASPGPKVGRGTPIPARLPSPPSGLRHLLSSLIVTGMLVPVQMDLQVQTEDGLAPSSVTHAVRDRAGAVESWLEGALVRGSSTTVGPFLWRWGLTSSVLLRTLVLKHQMMLRKPGVSK